MNQPKYHRVLLKLSGEALAPKEDGILDFDFIEKVAQQIKRCIDAGVQIAVIVGAGNIWRGRQGTEMDRCRADHMGMLATCINALALQDVFLRFIKHSEKVTNEEHAKALLIRITINCSKSMLSSSWFKKTEPLSESLSVSQPESDTLDAVLRLPKKYRTVIHLHYYMGYSIDEIAEILNTKSSTVKSQLHRARKQLKLYFEGAEINV